MTARRPTLATALALALVGCVRGAAPARRRDLPPPAREVRAGAPARSAGPATGPREPRSPDALRAVAAADALVGRRTIVVDGVDYGTDCAALVRAALQRAGHPLPADARDAAALHALAARRGALKPPRRAASGDVVFLAERPGGAPAHVALVARTEPDGTAWVLYRVARGVLRMRLNLSWPDRRTDPATGALVNDTLIAAGRAVPAGSLVVGAADLLGDAGSAGR
jgi:hypothetical protein